jgi:hypothetical protein
MLGDKANEGVEIHGHILLGQKARDILGTGRPQPPQRIPDLRRKALYEVRDRLKAIMAHVEEVLGHRQATAEQYQDLADDLDLQEDLLQEVIVAYSISLQGGTSFFVCSRCGLEMGEEQYKAGRSDCCGKPINREVRP